MSDDMIVSIKADTTGFEESLKGLEKRAASFGNTITKALKDAALSGKSLETILLGIAQSMISSTVEQGLAPLSGLLNNLGGSLFSGLGKITPFANGGVIGSGPVVSTPTYFPMTSGIGKMGEAGAEAIMPLQRMSDGSLGISAGNAGARGPNVTVNIATNDVKSFQRSQGQISAALARAVTRGQRAT